ncbi:hypothetical protein T01_4679 [Trichinella spiralis]|uniref:Uncharacterized protein n=1 Tax=Trichinella spiralis TaxID=6334 RepID=A0A0V1AQM3_TRISP|nr:hypothetical protein T01_4679 [Trichinella spiralis]
MQMPSVKRKHLSEHSSLATSARIVRVHKWPHQPPVEYEQADVSTLEIQHIKKTNIMSRNFVMKISIYV